MPRVEIFSGLGRLNPPQFMPTDAHFWVKIGFKFHSLGKILNISTSDPTVLLCQFQHWKCSQYKVISIQASSVLQSPLSPQSHHHSATLIHTIFVLDHPPSSAILVTSQHHKPFHTSPLYPHAPFNDSSVVNMYTFHGVPLKTFLWSKSFVLSLSLTAQSQVSDSLGNHS